MNDIVMPRLSDSMTEGTVVKWLKSPGDQITRGEPIVEIETDKATITYEADSDGVLAEILVGEGETVPIGQQIARLETAGGEAAAPPSQSDVQGQPEGQQQVSAQPTAAQPTPEQSSRPQAAETSQGQAQPTEAQDQTQEQPATAPPSSGRVKASPIARRLARRLGVDLGRIEGTGPGGRIIKEDVEAAASAAATPGTEAQQPTQAPAPAETDKPAESDEPAATDERPAPLPLPEETESSPSFDQPAPLPTPDEPHFAPLPLPDESTPQPGEEQLEPLQVRDEPQFAPLPTPDEPPPDEREFAQVDQDPQADESQPEGQLPPLAMPPEQPAEPPAHYTAQSPARAQEQQGQPAMQPTQPPAQQPPAQQPPAQQPPAQPTQPPLQTPPPAQPMQPPAQPGQPGAWNQPPAAAPGTQAPLPGPPSFVPGMTGGFPPIDPTAGLPGQQQIPPQYQQPAQAQPPQPQQQPQPAQQQGQPPQGSPTATRGQAFTTNLTNAQQTVARRMAESKATAPDFFVEVDVDMTNAVNYREQLKLSMQPAPSFNDMAIKASALALRQFPKVNGAYKDGRFEQYGDVNVGFVVAAGDLLAMPTLIHADQKGLSQIARESRELAGAVRNRTIQPAQLSGGTFSVSNLGMFGVDRFTAIINPPQAAILAVGAIKRRPVIAEDGVSLAVRQIMTVTLTCDHRIVYGTDGAEFLQVVKAWLESPQSLPL